MCSGEIGHVHILIIFTTMAVITSCYMKPGFHFANAANKCRKLLLKFIQLLDNSFISGELFVFQNEHAIPLKDQTQIAGDQTQISISFPLTKAWVFFLSCPQGMNSYASLTISWNTGKNFTTQTTQSALYHLISPYPRLCFIQLILMWIMDCPMLFLEF